jgi:hypothetical protein
METTVAEAAPARPMWRHLITATALGWAMGIAIGVGLIILVESLGVQSVQTPLVLGVALGVSTQQMRALRPVLAGGARQWILLSCIGLAAPFAVVDIAALAGYALPYSLVGFVCVGGVAAAVLQWSMLRRRVHHAVAWLVGAPLGCFGAASTVWLNERVLPKTPGLAGAVQYLAIIMAGGVVFGIVTAVAVARFEPCGEAGSGA